ncbi:integral membrane protein [Streptomyces gancidicus BKS 13-15]|uniref:Integral membrane protein n=1 Tax=Streptomyces gancidicus BKS 13-15 TaxID=1284664 RepID=M3D8S8_STREZ|nr:integral membrane protein [Streptomyces gancidicus BKS 13-15]
MGGAGSRVRTTPSGARGTARPAPAGPYRRTRPPPAAPSAAPVQQHPRHQRRIVVHRHMPAPGQPNQPRPRNDLLRPHPLPGDQQTVPRPPRHRHRNTPHVLREPHGPARPQRTGEPGRLGQRPRLRDHRLRRTAPGPGVDRAGQHGPSDRGPGQPLDHPRRHPLRDPPHGGQHGEGVPPLGPRPETGGGQSRHRPHQLCPSHLQRQQPAQGVARDMRPVQLQRLAQGAERGGHRGQVVVEAVGQGGGGAEAGQVHGDHLALGGEDVHDRVPGLPVMPDAVQQEQRFTAPHARVGHGHGPRAALSGDLAGDGRGHQVLLVRTRGQGLTERGVA